MYPYIKKQTLDIPLKEVMLKGDLSIPAQAHGIIIFAHGTGSSRLSTRNRMVAEFLNKQGLATLLFDLLTPSEDMDTANRFDIPLLAKRLEEVTNWVTEQESCSDLLIGYFGASTGAAAALMAAVDLPRVKAIVSRGGRPDLAMKWLSQVKVPTLLIVGHLDTEVLKLNQQAYAELSGKKKLEIIHGATHLFEERGAMEKVCALASGWFELHLQPLQLIL